MRSLASLVLLLPSLAIAQSWSITRESGDPVMEESSVVTFRVTNNSSSNQLTELTLMLDKGQYEIEGGVAPAGWKVMTVDKHNQVIKFASLSTNPCSGISPRGSALFGLRVIGVAAGADVANDGFITGNGNNKTFAVWNCKSNTAANLSSGPTWKRVGLASSLSVSPRALDVNGDVTATLMVTNQTSNTQSGIVPTAPVLGATDSAAFSIASGPMPNAITLGPGETGSFMWTLTATGRGLANLHASAGNGPATSPVARSELLNVGEFPGEVFASPDRVTSGSVVTVSLTVANNSSEPYENIVPIAPTLTGSASGTLQSGPEPASLASLSPGAAARFKWTYKISGTPGDTFTFTTQASATRDGATISTDPVSASSGEIVTYTVTATPVALPAGSNSLRTITYRVSNGGSTNLTKVALIMPASATFPNPAQPTKSGWNATQSGGNPKTLLWEAVGTGIPAGWFRDL